MRTRTTIDYITQHGYAYRIAYCRAGLFLYKWDIVVRKSAKEDDFLGLIYGETKTAFPKSKMRDILIGYAEYKDEQNLKRGVNLDFFRMF